MSIITRLLFILDTTSKRLSIDIAMKLSRMLGTSVDYWLNLQKNYDTLIAEFESEKELEYDKKKFEAAVEYALTLTTEHKDFYLLIKKAFADAGVIFVVLPNLPGSGINGATKKVGQNVMLMVNDRRFYSDTFWFTLFHEIGHIIDGDYGITFEGEQNGQEDAADKYAEDKLIPPDAYKAFLEKKQYGEQAIRLFAQSIGRDPGIVLGRLQNDKKVAFTNAALSKALRHKYKVVTA